MRFKRCGFEVVPHPLPVESQSCTKTQALKYTVCWVDRERRSCFCDALCRRGPTIAESWAKQFAPTANAPVSHRRNWPSGLTCTTISSAKSSAGTWKFHWGRCSKSQKHWASAGVIWCGTSELSTGTSRLAPPLAASLTNSLQASQRRRQVTLPGFWRRAPAQLHRGPH